MRQGGVADECKERDEKKGQWGEGLSAVSDVFMSHLPPDTKQTYSERWLWFDTRHSSVL